MIVIVLSLVTAMTFMLPLTAHAQESGKTVRVGWYESPFNMTDQFGRRSGYAYDYQQKIVAYTGWNYEYVEGSWPDLLQMLMDGEIDLMSDVSYTNERAELMLFSSLPMGAEEYYIFISPGNEEIWTGMSPVTPSELKELEIYAATYGIELSVCQNCFGHLTRFLIHPK